MLYLDEALKAYFRADLPLFNQLMALKGECYRDLDGRKTMRVMLGDKAYFIKQHRGVGYREIFKNLLQLKWPVISARNEWRALQALQQAGVPVPRVAGYGERGWNPAHRESFILMEALAPVLSLETLCATWQSTTPDISFKRQLIQEVAYMTRIMHEQGINHRDLYICHFLLNQASDSIVPHLFLIDLHRAAMRARVPERWLVKDLAGLYFSSLDAGLTDRDRFRFMKDYRKQSLRDILRHENEFWMKVKKRGDDLYRDHAK